MNTLLDDYRLLKQRPAAKQHENLDHFVVEGPRIIQRLLACGYTIRSIIVQCGKPHEVLGELPSEVPIFDLTREQMSELAGFDFHRGYLASAVRRPFSDPTTVPVKDPLMLGLFGITDMENMGSLLRSAAAFGVSKVFLDHASVDPYSRRVCRVSMGASLSMQYFLMDEPGVVLPQLHSKGITSLAATPSETATPIDSLPNRRVSTLLLMGNESEGLAESVLQAAAVQVRIAMTVRQSATVVDSLNVSVAGAILMHELRKRQDVCT